MKKIFTYDKYKLTLYDVCSTIIYNDEKIKNRLLNILPLEDYIFINSDVIPFNISVKKYLELNGFKMNLIPYFNLQTITNKIISSLDLSSIIYIKVLSALSSNEGIVIFDNIFTYLSDEQKQIIKKYLSENHIIYINITSDIEDVFMTKNLMVLTESGVAIEGKTEDVLSEEKLLKRLGFNLPFIFDLSLKLKSYDLVKKTYTDVDGLVNALWK